MKFLVDEMLGRLVRFLRILGFDTIYANDLEDIFKISPVPDEKLIIFAENDNRIIITKDYPLYKSYNEKSIYLKGEGIENYLKQLSTKLDLSFTFNIESARCSICNSGLEKVQKELIQDQVFKKVLNQYNEFYQCVKCKKVYWRGSHIEDITNRLDEIMEGDK